MRKRRREKDVLQTQYIIQKLLLINKCNYERWKKNAENSL